jgi:hypothetical protein
MVTKITLNPTMATAIIVHQLPPLRDVVEDAVLV